MIATTVKLSQNKAFLATEMDGEVVMMDTEDGTYFSLSAGVGTRIWELLETPKTVAELSKLIIAEFDVAPEECESDILEYANELVQNNILFADA